MKNQGSSVTTLDLAVLNWIVDWLDRQPHPFLNHLAKILMCKEERRICYHAPIRGGQAEQLPRIFAVPHKLSLAARTCAGTFEVPLASFLAKLSYLLSLMRFLLGATMETDNYFIFYRQRSRANYIQGIMSHP